MSIGPNQQRKHFFGTLNFGNKQKHALEHIEDIEEYFLTADFIKAFKGQLEEGGKTKTPHFQFELDTTKILRRKTLENLIVKGTGVRPWLDERRGNTNYATKKDGRLREPIFRGRIHEVRVVQQKSTMFDIVTLLSNGSSESDIFNFYPLAYFQWGPKIRDFIKARERLHDASADASLEEE